MYKSILTIIIWGVVGISGLITGEVSMFLYGVTWGALMLSLIVKCIQEHTKS